MKKGIIKNILVKPSQRRWFWFCMFIILLFYPYILVDAYLPILNLNIYFYFFLGALLTFLIISLRNRKKVPRVLWLITFIMTIGCLISFIMTGGRYYYHKLVMLWPSICLLIIIHNKIGLLNFYKLYNIWILVMAILGVIGFILSLSGIGPFFTFTALNDGRTVSSWIITFSKQEIPSSGFMRYSGFFDEPGAMAYWGMFALVINKLFIKNKSYELLLIVCLLFTFSMGYIAQIIVYIVLFELKGKITWKKISSVILISILALSLYSTRNTEYHAIYDATFGRFEAASQGSELLEGTTREILTQRAKEEFKKHPIFGNGRVKDSENLNDNPYETLAYDGIFGTLYLYFPYLILLFWGIKYRDYDLIVCTIFMSLAIFHRPIHSNLLTYLVYYSIPVMYALKLKESKQRIFLDYGTR